MPNRPINDGDDDGDDYGGDGGDDEELPSET